MCSSTRLVLPLGTGLIGEEHKSDLCAMTPSGDLEDQSVQGPVDGLSWL
jgi:hypothetical protein